MHLPVPGQSTSTEDSEDDHVEFPGTPPAHQSVWAIQEFFFMQWNSNSICFTLAPHGIKSGSSNIY